MKAKIEKKAPEDWARMWEAVHALRPEIGSPTDLAGLLLESAQSVNNWRRRGLPKPKILFIAQKIGCDATWLESGKGEMITPHLEDVLRAIPRQARQSVLDFLSYQLNANAGELFAKEKIGSYNAMIESIRADMERKRNGG